MELAIYLKLLSLLIRHMNVAMVLHTHQSEDMQQVNFLKNLTQRLPGHCLVDAGELIANQSFSIAMMGMKQIGEYLALIDNLY